MAITRTAMIAIVRQMLADLDSTAYTWTDARLSDAIDEAVREYSHAYPRQQTATIATTNGSRDISVAGLAGLIGVEAVEWPTGQYPPSYQRFRKWGSTLALLTSSLPDGTNASVYWNGLHTYDDTTQTVDTAHEVILERGAAGFAAVREADKKVNEVPSGGEDVWQRYLRWGQAQLRQFRGDLRRIGEQGALKPRQLYGPDEARRSQSRDFGP